MTTRERRPRKFRQAWNLWHVAAFALLPAGAAVALWGIETQGGTRFRVFMTVAQVLELLALVCLARGYKRKLAAAATRGQRMRTAVSRTAAAGSLFEDIFTSA